MHDYYIIMKIRANMMRTGILRSIPVCYWYDIPVYRGPANKAVARFREGERRR